MRLALATWNGRISPVFDVSRQLLVIDLDAGREMARREEPLPGTDPRVQADRVAALGVQTLICGAVSQPMAVMLEACGVDVIPFRAGPVEQVFAAWMTGGLADAAWRMPGCRGRRRRFRCGQPSVEGGAVGSLHGASRTTMKGVRS